MKLIKKTSITVILFVFLAVCAGFGGVSLIKQHKNAVKLKSDSQNTYANNILSFSEWDLFGSTKEDYVRNDIVELRDFQNARNGFSANFFKYALIDGGNLLKSTDNFLSAIDNLKELRTRVQSVATISGGQDYLSKQLDLTAIGKQVAAIKRIMTNGGKVVFLLLDNNQINPIGGKILESRVYRISSGEVGLESEEPLSPEIIALLSRSDYADIEALAFKIKKYYPGENIAVIAIDLSGLKRIVRNLGVIELPEEKMVVDADNLRTSALKKKDLFRSVMIIARDRLKDFSMEKSLSFSENVGEAIKAGNIKVVLPEEDALAVATSPETNYLSLKPVFTAPENSPLRAKVEINTEILPDGTEMTDVALRRSEPDTLKGLENLFVIVPDTIKVSGGSNENKRTGGLEGLEKGLMAKEFDSIGRTFSFKYENKMDILSGKSYRFLYKGQKGVDMPVSVKITVSGGYIFKETGRSEYTYESLDPVEELPIILTLVRL